MIDTEFLFETEHMVVGGFDASYVTRKAQEKLSWLAWAARDQLNRRFF